MRDDRQLNAPPQNVDCTDVVRAVAEREGIAPSDLSPQLYDVIEPDALQSLLSTETTATDDPVIVRFHYAGYDVVVGSDGTLEIR